MSPSVFIIILQYNHSQDTIKCLGSVGKLTYPNFQVVVVDNASESSEKENTTNFIKDKENIILIQNEKNLGYAGGNNVGIRYALEHSADYVFILNNDTTIEPDLLDKLVAVAENDPQVGIVGPAIKEGNEKTAYYGKIAWLKAELKHVYDQSAIRPALDNGFAPLGSPLPRSRSVVHTQGSTLQKGEYVIGAAMLIKKEVLEKIAGFDEVYFLYFEDADLCLRAQIAGYKLKIAPEAMISHQVSTSTSSLGKPLILRYHTRNALIFNSLNAPWSIRFSLIFWSGYILLKNFLKVFLFPSTSWPNQAGEAIIDGVLDFYKNHYGKIS